MSEGDAHPSIPCISHTHCDRYKFSRKRLDPALHNTLVLDLGEYSSGHPCFLVLETPRQHQPVKLEEFCEQRTRRATLI